MICVWQLFFERLVKRKWLSNMEPYEQIEALIKEDFKKYRRMDSPPYQVGTPQLPMTSEFIDVTRTSGHQGAPHHKISPSIRNLLRNKMIRRHFGAN